MHAVECATEIQLRQYLNRVGIDVSEVPGKQLLEQVQSTFKGDTMGIADPEIQTSEKFTDFIKEGESFTLLGVRIARGIQTKGYGEGDMVVLTVRHNNEQRDLGIWGNYLLAQAESAEPSDFPGVYQIVRKRIPEFSRERDVKALQPVTGPHAKDDDIPL